jgi:hypothetical protein
MTAKYLTKSRFKLAIECPTKLFYTGKKEYANNSLDNPFLEALAEGGFQVGELAKYYYPGGHSIHTLDYQDALEQTNQLLEQDNVIIYEAAIKHNNLFIRIDILVKKGNSIKLIEVKSKSIKEHSNRQFFTTKEGVDTGIYAEWKPYLYDVAFQRYVTRSSLPDLEIKCFLLLADKTAKASADGINQKFQIVEDKNRRKGIEVSSSLNQKDLSVKLLHEISVDDACNLLIATEKQLFILGQLGFVKFIDKCSENYKNDKKLKTQFKSKCKSCEFNAKTEDLDKGLLSGFIECGKENLGWSDQEANMDTVLDIWNHRSKDRLIAEGKIKFSDLSEEDIDPKKKNGESRNKWGWRQWLQIEKSQNDDSSIFLNKTELRNMTSQWVFPLHFIDFETSKVAIPFNQGRNPYEGVAFQFSHHVIDENGAIVHKGEYLNTEPGFFPNYEFLRQLRKELVQDNGTIFRYASHENTFLNEIYKQIKLDTNPISDKDELCAFIELISHPTEKSPYQWTTGNRDMVDLLDLVKQYYYNPQTNGSNSLKYVLPATINSSDYLKQKYSQPIYGCEEMPSSNFKDHQWLDIKDGLASNPYENLSELFDGASTIKIKESDETIKDGGAAMTAYAKLQFEEISSDERSKLQKNLLRYCELDTLAMVMIYEAWKNWLK